MASNVKSMPIWPGLDMSPKVKLIVKKSAMNSGRMATVKAARIIEQKSIRLETRK